VTDPDCVLFRIPDTGVLSSVNQYGKFLSLINAPVIGRFSFSPRRWPDGITTLIGELDAIICETESQRSYIKKTYDVTTEVTPIIPNGVDVEKFTQPCPPANDRQTVREVSSFTDSFENVYGFVGRVDKYRCVKEIISGFSASLSSKPSAGLVVAGDGDQLEVCKQLVQELGISENVLFLGHIDHENVPYLLSEVDLVFALSHREVIDYTTPIKLFEALGASVPVIASDGGDFHKYVDESVGVLISDHEPESVSRGIQTVSSRAYESEDFERKVRPYSWNSYAERVTSIAQELID
jgi:1,2-diacylglycerol 3-alpha-glucosyltransferase